MVDRAVVPVPAWGRSKRLLLLDKLVRVGEPGLLGAGERRSSSAALGEVKLTFKHACTQALRPRHHDTAMSVSTISQNSAKSTQFTRHTFLPREGRLGRWDSRVPVVTLGCHTEDTRRTPTKYNFGCGRGPAK